MKPGRELDALVAEKVMGLAVAPRHCCGAQGYGLGWDDHCDGCDFNKYRLEVERDGGCIPTWKGTEYSTEIAAAWEVVEKLLGLGYTLELYSPGALINDEFGTHSVGWGAEFCTWSEPYLRSGRVGEAASHTMDEKSGGAAIETVRHAICLAALEAVEENGRLP